MSKNKRIFKKNDNKEYPEYLLYPCFQISPDVELKDVPTTGEEYLLKVIKERQNCSPVTKCNKDYSMFAKNQSCFVNELTREKAPDTLKPTIEWQNIQVADFSDVRMYLSRLQAKKSHWPCKVKHLKMGLHNIEGWRNFFENQEPTLSCVLGIPHYLVDRALEILIEMLDEVEPGNTIDYKTGLWIYTLLVCTRQPLLSDTTSMLRQLARKCAEIRAHLNTENETTREASAPLNVFICLVSRYFRQYDLAD